MRNLLLIGATAIAIAASGPAAAQEVTLRLSAHQSANSPDWTRVVEPLIEFIETKSGGRIKVEGYPNGVLHGGADGVEPLGLAALRGRLPAGREGVGRGRREQPRRGEEPARGGPEAGGRGRDAHVQAPVGARSPGAPQRRPDGERTRGGTDI